jgi:RND family efflux transporter MFP subunit
MTDQKTLQDALSSLRLDRKDDDFSPRKKKRWPLLFPAILLPALAVVFFGGPTKVTTAVAEEARVAPGQPVPVLNASGYVVARRQATVSSKVTGRISEISVEEGLQVAEGQVLARLDDAEVQRSLALTQAQLDAARKSLREIEVRLAQAKLELGRTEKLVGEQIRSQSDLDAAQAEVGSLDARLAVAKQEVEVAERALAVERQQLENTVIRAPFAGVAISKNAQPGEMISPVSAGGGFTRTGVSTIVDMASLEIEVDVNENYIDRVRSGQRVEARLNAYPDWKIPASVITTVPAADRESATVRVRIRFDSLDPKILPEMGAKVTFLADPAEAGAAAKRVSFPAIALRQDGDDEVVFVAKDGVAARRVVRVERRDGDRAIVESGVSVGEAVIVDGGEKLKDGRKVRPRTP